MEAITVIEKVREAVDVYDRFVDGLERKNQFDMNDAFGKLYYEHLKLLSDICDLDELSEMIDEIAEDFALDSELLRLRTENLMGLDLNRLLRKE